jgi:ribosomal protein S8
MSGSNLRELQSKLMVASRDGKERVYRTKNTGPLVMNLLHLLVDQGYLASWKRRDDERSQRQSGPKGCKAKPNQTFEVILRYTEDGQSALKSLQSRQGLSSQMNSLPLRSLWTTTSAHGRHTRVVTTTEGVMTDREARQRGLGGRPILRVK